MSDKLNDAEFWLPSEFLTEEDIVMDSYGVLGSSRFRFTPEFNINNHGSFTPSTGSSSPVESMFCSTETQSDEGDSLGSELTQLLNLLHANRLTQSNQYHEKKGYELSGTQMLPLTRLTSGSGRNTMPNNGSLNGSFLVSSHGTGTGTGTGIAPSSGNEDAWDLIYKAAGQAAMLKNNGRCGGAPISGHLGPQIVPLKPSIPSPLYRNQLLKSENLLENNGLIYEQIYRRRAMVSDGLVAGGFNSFTCPPPEVQLKNQQQGGKNGFHLTDGYGFGPGYGYGSGARIGGVGGGKSERVGTGVFLPRRYGTDDSSGNVCSVVNPRKKLATGSAVDLQSKGNPALKNLYSPTSVSNRPSQLGVSHNIVGSNETSVARMAALLTLQRAFPEGAAAAAINHDVCLPQEWTY